MAIQTVRGSTWNAKDNNLELNVKDFGAVGDGVTDDTSAVGEAIAALPSGSSSIYFPEGSYLLSAQLTIADKPVSISGDGIGVSILKWSSGSTSSGISISQSSDAYATTISNLSFHTELVATGTAISVDGTGQLSGGIIQNRINPRTIIENIDIRGNISPNTDGWATGILYTNVIHTRTSNVSIIGNFSGSQPNIQSASGIVLTGDGAPTEHSIFGCNVFYVQKAVNITGTVEGVYLTHCNLVAVKNGVDWDSDNAAPPQLSVNNCHMNIYDVAVIPRQMSQSVISNCLFYVRADGVNNAVGVQLAEDCQHTSIHHNTFVNNSVFNYTAVTLVGSGTHHIMVDGNVFQSGTTAVFLQAGVFDNVVINNIINNSYTNDVIDSSGNTRNLIQTIETSSAPRMDSNLSVIDMNALGSGDRTTRIDIHSDDINTDYSSRIIRNGGVNADLDLINAGGGDFRVFTDNKERLRVTGSGGLELNDGETGDRNTVIDLHSDDTNTDFSSRILRGGGVNGTYSMVNAGTGAMLFGTNSVSRVQIPGNENAVQFVSNAVKITTGTGSPEGVVTAAVSSIYLRADGGANTSLWVKESGAGNTGWVSK